MLSIPGSLHKQFAEHLAEKGVPPGQHGAYLKWLRYYQATDQGGGHRPDTALPSPYQPCSEGD